MKKVLVEALLVAIAGAAFAFTANQVSPRGLSLAQNYFPERRATPETRRGPKPEMPATSSTNAAQPAVESGAAARLREKGLQVVNAKEALELFHDPGCETGVIVFIDARNDEHYQAGHIPGAWQFDRFHPADSLGAVLPVCQTAQKIVVYCNGGDCEDSEFAAMFLRDNVHVPNEKLYVFSGGITEWEGHSWPVESGARKSGTIRGQSK